MTAPARFRQIDVTRAARAVRQAGYDGARIRIDCTGTMEIILGRAARESDPNPWDEDLDE